MISNRVTATIRAMDSLLGLKQIPAGPSRVRAEAKAQRKRTEDVWGTVTIVTEHVRARVPSVTLLITAVTVGYGGYGGYATHSIRGSQTGL